MKPPRKKSMTPKGYLPFPVPIQHGTKSHGNSLSPVRFVCKAIVEEDCSVTVSAPGDMDFLYNMGFYGKGSLSKHEPVFHKVVEQDASTIEKHLSDMSMERYLCSVHTSLRAESHHKELVTPQRFVDMCSDNLDDMRYTPSTSSVEGLNDTASHNVPNIPSSNNTYQQLHGLHVPPSTGVQVVEPHHLAPHHTDTDIDIHVYTKPSHPMDDETDLLPVSNVTTSHDDWDNCEADEAFWESDTNHISSEPTGAQSEVKSVCETADEKPDVAEVMSHAADCGVMSHPMECGVMSYPMECADDNYSSSNITSYDNSVTPAVHSDLHIDSVTLGEDLCTESGMDSSDDDCLPFSDLDIHDNSISGEDKSKYYSMSEHLILQPCEAVFLSLAFDCLHLSDGRDKQTRVQEVSLQELWKRCIARDKSFLPKYAVYHHIRAKGWIPKDGLTYGCDFMVYKKGPKYYHSSLGVIVRCCDAGSLKDIDTYNPRKLTWAKLMGLARVINNVRKELMVCYVLMPDNLTEQELSSPKDCLRKLTITETLLSRIIPSKERDQESTSKVSGVTTTSKQVRVVASSESHDKQRINEKTVQSVKKSETSRLQEIGDDDVT